MMRKRAGKKRKHHTSVAARRHTRRLVNLHQSRKRRGKEVKKGEGGAQGEHRRVKNKIWKGAGCGQTVTKELSADCDRLAHPSTDHPGHAPRPASDEVNAGWLI